jgi:hypothetical protein
MFSIELFEERPALICGGQFDDTEVLAMSLKRSLEAWPAVNRVAPHPSKEFEINSLIAANRLDRLT